MLPRSATMYKGKGKTSLSGKSSDGTKKGHSFSAARPNHTLTGVRDRSTVNRLHMYRTKAFKRDRAGKIIEGAGDLTSRIPQVGAGRTAPNRKWFGTTRVVDQADLTRFRNSVSAAAADPYAVLLKSRKLPLALIHDADDPGRALAGEKLGLLANEPYDQVFTQARSRKRPRLGVTSMEGLAADAASREEQFVAKVEAAAASPPPLTLPSSAAGDGMAAEGSADVAADQATANADAGEGVAGKAGSAGDDDTVTPEGAQTDGGAAVATGAAAAGPASASGGGAAVPRPVPVAASAADPWAEFKDANRGRVFDKGQSRRIWGELHKVVDSSDVVIQVLDSRDPMGTRCRYVERLLAKRGAHKQLVLLLNKCDLVPTWVTSRWLRILSREHPTLAFHASVNHSFGKGALINVLRQLKKLHADKKSISVGIVGYPNVGKSSVINTLRGKKVVNVAPVPGETKVWQYVTLYRQIFLVDCPGVVHQGECDSQADAVLKGVVRVESLGDTAVDYIGPLLLRVSVEAIRRAYGVQDWTDGDDFCEKLARRSGKLLKKGEPDVTNVARAMLSDFQRGKLPWFVPPPDETVEERQKGKRVKEVKAPKAN